MRKKKKTPSEPSMPPRTEASTLEKHAYRGTVFYIDYYPNYPDESRRYGYCVFVDPPLETSGLNTGPQFASRSDAERAARRDILMSEIRTDED